MNHRMRLDENQVLTPPAKGKGASTSSRCQAASGNDDATLAQKREYWRNKKREQRARLAKRRGKATLDRKPQHPFCPEGVHFTMSASPGASSSSYPRNDQTYVSQCRNAVPKTSHGAADTPKEEWHQKTEVNKVFLSVLAEAAEKASVRHKVVPSPLFSGSQRDTGPSVPAVRVMAVNNGRSPKAAALHASLQDVSVRQTLCKPETAVPVQVTHRTNTRISAPHGPFCEEPPPKATHPAAQRGAKAPTLSEEERAAKRREQWRLKKREQRAKTAAQSREVTCQKTRLMGPSDPHAPQTAPGPILRSFSSVRLQSSAAAVTNMHKSQINVPHTCGNKSDFPFNATTGKKPSDSQRKAHGHACKTPRQRFIEVQKNLPIHRKLRGKSLSAAINIPRTDPSDTPETMIAKRREYWRVKKREQRAKLTMEMKTRLREKDSLTRRVKRYQQILGEMRKARAVQASGAIGGFIREDGTLALDIPPSSKCQDTARHERKEEHRKVSKNSPIIPQRSCAPIGMLRPCPPLPPSSASSAPALQSTRSSPRPKTTTVPYSQSPLKVWAPQPSSDPSSGPNSSRCVVKAAVTSRFSSSDPGDSEEVRVAKKREYWRTKKREQRAALAARLKLGLSAALRRRKAQRQEPAASPLLCRGLTRCTRNGPPLYSNTPPIAPQAEDIKQEGESVQAADPNPQPEQAISPDKKPPAAPFAPPGSQQESADSQAATLLAVASMKKLLEESLSSVAGCKVLQTEVKTEAGDDILEADSQVSPPQPDVHRDSLSPISADVAMLLNDWQPDDQTWEKKPVLQTNETVLFLPLSEDKYSAQSPSESTQSFGAPNDRLLPCGVQGPCSRNRGQETCGSPEPPKLHHITQACFQQPEPEGGARWRGATTSRAGMEQVGSSSLQKKREYWKLMKRQQRARLKERRREDRSSLLLTGSIQINQILQSDLPASSGGEGPSLLPRLLVSQSTSSTQESSDTLHGKLPCRVEKRTSTQRALEPQQYVQKWIPRTNKVTCVPSLPALKPPENPLSSLNLQPFESPARSPASITSSRKAPNNQVKSSSQSAPPCTMLPPKLLPGESEKDFTKRKREYWRVKKKEQRAKKAIQNQGFSPRIGPSSWSPSFHPQDLQPQAGPAQGSAQWGIPSEGPDDFKSLSVDSHAGQCAEPLKDESEPLYPDNEEEEEEEEEEALPGTVWRKHYLMDYDPLNQLLVCMVCGELQYSHSLGGVRAHIQELHPHSMTLQPQEKQQILEAWDEQVSQRERFFSRQLQHHSRDLTERNC